MELRPLRSTDIRVINYVRPLQRRRVDCRKRCQQARAFGPSTSFVDNTMDLLWRNFLRAESGTKFQREVPVL